MMKIDPARLPAPPAENTPLPAAQPSLETLGLLARRRSTPIGLMTSPGPSRAEIEALIALAARVPDHGKLGPWRFLVIEGAARERAGEKLAALVAAREPNADAARLKGERERLTRAPVVIAVISTAAPHAKIPEWEQVLSSGAVAFQLVLAAHAMGYAGAWLTEWLTYDAEARAALGLAPHERIAGLVYLGTAKADPPERVRPDVKQRIAWHE
jgi:nitroreductase